MNSLSAHMIRDMIFQLETLEQHSNVLRKVRQDLWGSFLALFGELKGQDAIFMMKNKYGLTKESAKKLFYDFRKKKQEEGESSDKEPESVDEKIEIIMGYMQETTTKLDRIEEDISTLKKQVQEILKRI